MQLMTYVRFYARQNDGNTFLVRAFDQHRQVVHRRRIYKRNLTHSDDSNRVFFARYMRHDVVKTVGYAEEIRTIYLVHLHAVRYCQVIQIQLNIRVFVGVYLVVDCADLGLLVGAH